MKEKYKKSEFGDAILVDDGTDWNLVAALYGYNGSIEQDAPGVAERAALFVAAPNLLERAEAAEARVAELEARVEALETEVMQQHHIASACAAECERQEDERDQLRAELEKIRGEALERFNASDKDHTTDSDTAAWLLDIAQELEQPQ